MELTLPESARASPEGPRLVLRAMALGARDSSGRRRPEPTDRIELVDCDLLVAAVGEAPDTALLDALGIPRREDGRPIYDAATQLSKLAGVYVGGDAARGPASIITASADGRRAAYSILRAAGIEPPRGSYAPPPPDPDKLAARGAIVESLRVETVGPGAEAFVAREAQRCLNCDAACLRCVEVCPNRANFALPIGGASAPGIEQAIQILHVDALCNECGNCGVFCPYEGGEPYRGKPTLFRDRRALEASKNLGFAIVANGDDGGPRLVLREAPGEAVRELAYEAWAASDVGPMAALAKVVYLEHPYLIGGRP
jgi:putative selenate reductase